MKLKKILFVIGLLQIFTMRYIAQEFFREFIIPTPVSGINWGNVVSGVDFDNDGKIEIYAVNNNWTDTPDELTPKIYKYELNNGIWEIVWSTILPGVEKQNTWPALTYGDWDNDGKMEIIWGPVNNTDNTTNPNPTRIAVYETKGDGSDIMGINIGSGLYKPNAQWSMTVNDYDDIRPIRWLLEDVDQDGIKELVYCSRVPGYRYGIISVNNIPDNGDGSEIWTTKNTGMWDPNIDPEIIYDLAVLNNTIYLFSQNGNVSRIKKVNGTWTSLPVQYNLVPGGTYLSAQTIDLDSDGNKEIVCGSFYYSSNNNIYILKENGDTLKSYPVIDLQSGGRIYSSDYGDIDGNGKIDIVFGTRDATPDASIYQVEFQSGSLINPNNWIKKLIDSQYPITGNRWNIINVCNLNGDSNDEVLYTSSVSYPAPLIILNEKSLTLTSPNGGENWIVGSAQNITWTSSGVSNVKIEYTTNNGSSWVAITNSVSANLGTYDWTVPNTPSTICKVRVSNTENSALNDLSDNVFTISLPQSISVISPNGGETWSVGSTQNITWASSGITYLKIEYTTNNGISWTSISNNVSGSLGTYLWNVVNTPSTECKIRISNVLNSTQNDVSDNLFTITTAPTITVTAPNGGENWTVGSTQNITWTSGGVNNVNLEFTTDSGGSWTTIQNSVSANLGTYAWTVPNFPSANCKVRVSDSSNPALNDLSDNEFTITIAPTITITAPNGGENWTVGSTQNITWTSGGITNVSLEYTTDSGSNWVAIQNSVVANLGTYSWLVPNSPSTNCKVRVSDSSNPALNDLSDNSFTIEAAPTITVTSPNGGENWTVGSTQNITWTSSGVSNVNLEYTTDNGGNWVTIQNSVPANLGTYVWIVLNTPSLNCKVRILNELNSAIKDLSDNTFTVFQYPQNITANKTINFGDVYQNSSCRIIGIPGNSNIPVATCLGGGTHQIDWNAYWDNGVNSNNSNEYLVEYNGTSQFTFVPGRAFWILSKNGFSIQQNIQSVPISVGNYYEIDLHQGWNLISNPFEKSVIWNQVIQLNLITLSPLLYGYPNTWTGTQTLLNPYEGYYFYNAHNLSKLKIPYNPSGNSTILFKEQKELNNNEILKISLMNSFEELSEVNFILSANSTNDIDEFDILAPPDNFTDSGLKIFNNELSINYKYLLTESRTANSEGECFNFVLKNNIQKSLSLKIQNIPNNLKDKKIFLLDKRINRFYNLSEINEIIVPSYYQKNEYNLFIGSEKYISLIKNEYQPINFSLEQNYPNPFNSSTVIRYSIIEKSEVLLEIFNSLGEKVESSQNQFLEPGTYEIQVNLENLASGVYYYRITAQSDLLGKQNTAVKKMLLIK